MAPPRKHSSDRILDVARAIVLAEGPRAATISAIARLSKAPVGTLYHRFGNRDGVLAEVWIRALERFQHLVLTHVHQQEHGLDRGVAMVRATLEFARSEPEDAKLLIALRRRDLLDAETSSEISDRIHAINLPLQEELRRLTVDLCGSDDPRALAGVARHVVLTPNGVVRAYVDSPKWPRWLVDDVIEDARRALQAIAQN